MSGLIVAAIAPATIKPLIAYVRHLHYFTPNGSVIATIAAGVLA